MNAQEIIERIRTAEKKTPVRVFLKEKTPLDFPQRHGLPLRGEQRSSLGLEGHCSRPPGPRRGH